MPLGLRRPERARTLLAAALLALGAAQITTLAARPAGTTAPRAIAPRPAAATAPASSPAGSPTPTAPPPRRVRRPQRLAVLIGLQPSGPGVARPLPGRVLSIPVSTPGRTSAVAMPLLPLTQRSVAAGEEVLTRVLSSSSHDQFGCGVAGCTQSTIFQTEQGLVLAGLHGEHPRLVTRGGFDSQPSFSPDGRYVVYVSHRSLPFQHENVDADVIAWMTASGRDLGVLVTPALDGSSSVGDPVWRPDSRGIAFERLLPGGSAAASRAQVVELRLPSKRQRIIATTFLRDLAWSPDGRTIAGVRDRLVRLPGTGAAQYVATGSDLWLVSAASGRSRQLTRLAPAALQQGTQFCGETGPVLPALRQPVWSPDSRTLAVATSYGHLADFARTFDVATVDVRSGRLRTIYRVPGLRCPGAIAGYAHEVGTLATVLGWANALRGRSTVAPTHR